MTWFRVDDNLAFHPKALTAGNAAMGLWVRAGSWSSQQLQDGFVPDAMVATLGNASQARALVTAGLWTRVDGGYHFHDWDHRNPLRTAVEQDRAAAAERQRRARERARESRRDIPSDSRVSDMGSHGPPDPTRPDPLVGATSPSPLTRPSPFCPRHPTGTDQPCRSCADARRASDAWTPPPTPTLPPVHEVLAEDICPDHGGIVGRCPGCRHGLAPTTEETQP